MAVDENLGPMSSKVYASFKLTVDREPPSVSRKSGRSASRARALVRTRAWVFGRAHSRATISSARSE